MFTKETVVYPDYYPAFACKCGDCRQVCCRGWGISVTEAEYFRLLGMNCRQSLRRRLDVAFSPADSPSPDRYALISPNYLGDCPLLSEDGLCSLQCAMGEAVLPEVCRVYPRAVRRMDGYAEISTSLSCEKTVELLISTTAPLSFNRGRIAIPDSGIPGCPSDPETEGIRRAVLDALGSRGETIGERILKIGRIVCPDGQDSKDSQPITTAEALLDLQSLILAISRKSRSIRDCGMRALRYLGLDEGVPEDGGAEAARRFRHAEEAMQRLLPEAGIYAEKVLQNHLFYLQFPFTEGAGTPSEAFGCFTVATACFKAILTASLTDAGSTDPRTAFVDITAELFRFFEHSDFYTLAKRGVLRGGMTAARRLAPLLR